MKTSITTLLITLFLFVSTQSSAASLDGFESFTSIHTDMICADEKKKKKGEEEEPECD